MHCMHCMYRMYRRLLSSLGLPCVSLPWLEADDVIGLLTRTAAARRMRVSILTGDADCLQLVDDNAGVEVCGRRRRGR